MRIGPFSLLQLQQGAKVEVSLSQQGQWVVKLHGQDGQLLAESKADFGQKAGIAKALRKIERNLTKAELAKIAARLTTNKQV
jgi:uncharacterized protein YegP (UPF0339 family)